MQRNEGDTASYPPTGFTGLYYLCSGKCVHNGRTRHSQTKPQHTMLKMMLLAGLGGFAGTCLRFGTSRLFPLTDATSFPWATFTVNSLGCLLIGLLSGMVQRGGWLSPAANALFITGFCGGLTTFSTFACELFNAGQQRQTAMALLYLVLSVAMGLCAVWAGRWMARAI